ncbi:unnamed protein product [Moneuplotes crassus]|uniref:ALA-interacting subunit n=1 Tax=Euplotes crassus TaxID=5936 RepID=A0AAD1XJD5_EUPCR|nr:unnamed protein product [Moneuplotes crassus]
MENDELLKAKEKKKRLEGNRFKQQTLPAWRPVPTIVSSMITFLVFGVIFLTFGIVLIEFTKDIVEVEYRYDNNCAVGSSCTHTLNIPEDMEQPIMVYYKIDNFFQNHRRYLKSINYSQLKGQNKGVGSLGSCDPIITNKDLGRSTSYGGTPLDPDAPANPCGLIAKTLFTDTYSISDYSIDETNIAWDSDVDDTFGQPANASNIQWVSSIDEHFIVWMRTAGMPNFRKLWGRIRTDIPKGSIALTVNNNYDVSSFDGKKTFILSTTNAFGGKNYLLAICSLVAGSLCFIFALANYLGSWVLKNNKAANEGNNNLHVD